MSLGSLVVNLAVNSASFIAGMAAASDATDKEMQSMTRSAERAGKAIGVAMAAAVGTVTVLVKQSINAADAMGKMAQSTGINVTALSELAYVAGLSDVSIEAFSVSMRSLNRNIADSASGIGDSGAAFKALGIDVKNADGSLKDADKVLGEVSDKFAGYADGAGKSALATRLLGRAGADMIPMLNQGSEEMQKLREEAKALGASIGTDAAQAAEKFNDNLTRLNQVKKGLANTVAQQLLPAMNKFTDDMVDAARNTDMLAVAAETAANGMRIFLSVMVGIGAAVRIAGDSVGKLAAAFALIAQGKWSAALEVLKDDSSDMASVMEGASDTIKNLWAEAGDAVVIEANRIKKAQTPLLAGPGKKGFGDQSTAEDLRNAQKAASEEIKAFAEAQKEAIFIAEQWQEQMDAEVVIMSEVAQWTAFYRNQQLEAERLVNEERNRAMIEYYDREQEEAIAQGEALIRIEEEAARRRVNGQRLHRQMDLDAAKSFFGYMSVLMNTKNREMFEIGKAAAIGETVINTYRAAEGAYAAMAGIPIIGPALGAAAAAAAILFGMAQVAAIKSTSFGSGGSATPTFAANPTTSAPVGTPADVGRNTRQTTILQVHGTTDEVKFARRIADLLNEDSRDGGLLLIA